MPPEFRNADNKGDFDEPPNSTQDSWSEEMALAAWEGDGGQMSGDDASENDPCVSRSDLSHLHERTEHA